MSSRSNQVERRSRRDDLDPYAVADYGARAYNLYKEVRNSDFSESKSELEEAVSDLKPGGKVNKTLIISVIAVLASIGVLVVYGMNASKKYYKNQKAIDDLNSQLTKELAKLDAIQVISNPSKYSDMRNMTKHYLPMINERRSELISILKSEAKQGKVINFNEAYKFLKKISGQDNYLKMSLDDKYIHSYIALILFGNLNTPVTENLTKALAYSLIKKYGNYMPYDMGNIQYGYFLEKNLKESQFTPVTEKAIDDLSYVASNYASLLPYEWNTRFEQLENLSNELNTILNKI